tara:strand:+ start:64 stop:2064 length:2001 start_codon:yes stop_codon:yes gene_type:complete
MADTIDNLVVRIKADTKQLQTELKKVEGKIKLTGAAGGAAFGMGAAGIGGKLKALAGPAVIGAVVIGLAKMTTFAVRAGMEFEDLKDSLDTVFGSVEAGDKQFKRILDFAQNTPFQIDTITKSFIALGSVGIEPTARQMQVFADTASVAVDQKGAFEALIRVVQRAEAGALGLQELNMLADRGIDVFKGLKDELGLSRLELADFGQTAGGAKLIIETLTTVLEDNFGGAMISKMDNLSTKLSNLKISFKLLGNEISESGLGGQLKGLTDRTSDFINSLALLLASIRGEGIGITLEAPQIEKDDTFEDKQKKRRETALANIKAINDKMVEVMNMEFDKGFFDSFKDAFEDNPVEFFGVTTGANPIKVAEQMMKDLNITREEAIELMENLRDAYRKEQDDLKNSARTKKEVTDADIKDLLVKGKLINAFGKIEEHLQKAAGDTKILEFAQANLGQIFEDNKEALIALGVASAEDLIPVLDAMTNKTDEAAESFKDILAPAIAQISASFTNQFVNALLEGENALDTFNDFAKNIVSQIIATFIQLAVVNKILNSIFGVNGMNVEGFDLPTMASGGTIQGNRPTLVGERGPEIFVPNTGGTIMNNMNSKNAMGDGGTTVINQSINFATGIVPTVRAEVMQMMPQIADVTKAAVQESAMRGGTFRRSLAGG